MTININKKTAVRVRQVPTIAPMLQTACDIYINKTGRKVEYKGGSLGSLMVRGVEVELITKRLKLPDAVLQSLLQ